MISCEIRNFRVHSQGGWRTDWHYRTSHQLQEILEAGDDYWNDTANLTRANDEILVEADDLSWRYKLIVRASQQHPPKVMVKMLGSLEVFDEKAIKEKAAEIALQEKQVKEREAAKAAREGVYDTDEVKPKVSWRGKGKWTILAYERTVQGGFETPEEAKARLEAGDFKEQIEVHRVAYINEQMAKAA